MSDADPVPATIRELIDTFRTLLPEVRFPDVDVAILERLAEELRERQAEVDRARVALDEARAGFDEARERLRHRALRGLAYAKVFAEGDDGLAQHLASIGLGRSARGQKQEKPARKRRVRSSPKAETVLPFDARADETPPDNVTVIRTM
jgi:hypothetical protein